MVNADPIGNCANLARALDRDYAAMRRWATRHGLVFKSRQKRLAIRAHGLVGQLFEKCDAIGISSNQVAKQLQVSPSTVTFWRKARSPIPFYAVEGLATLAGYELKLEKKDGM